MLRLCSQIEPIGYDALIVPLALDAVCRTQPCDLRNFSVVLPRDKFGLYRLFG